jgi:nuclear pore complex protein Nup160
MTMYQRAQKLQDLITDPSLMVPLGEEQLEAFLVAMNSLSLLDEKNAWIVMPISSDSGHAVSPSRSSDVIF